MACHFLLPSTNYGRWSDKHEPSYTMITLHNVIPSAPLTSELGLDLRPGCSTAGEMPDTSVSALTDPSAALTRPLTMAEVVVSASASGTVETYEPLSTPYINNSQHTSSKSSPHSSRVLYTSGSNEDRLADLEVQPHTYYGPHHFPRHFLVTFPGADVRRDINVCEVEEELIRSVGVLKKISRHSNSTLLLEISDGKQAAAVRGLCNLGGLPVTTSLDPILSSPPPLPWRRPCRGGGACVP